MLTVSCDWTYSCRVLPSFPPFFPPAAHPWYAEAHCFRKLCLKMAATTSHALGFCYCHCAHFPIPALIFLKSVAGSNPSRLSIGLLVSKSKSSVRRRCRLLLLPCSENRSRVGDRERRRRRREKAWAAAVAGTCCRLWDQCPRRESIQRHGERSDGGKYGEVPVVWWARRSGDVGRLVQVFLF